MDPVKPGGLLHVPQICEMKKTRLKKLFSNSVILL